MSGSATLLSEVRSVEAQLRQREQEIRSLADNSPDVLTRFDRDLRHVFVSAAITQATGRRPEELVGRTNRELDMPNPLCALWDEATREVFATGRPRRLEFVFDGPDGPRHFASRLVAEFDAAGEVRHVLAVSTDVTELKAIEAALEDANRRKDEFLATLAHELRNPLAPIRSGLQLLRHARDGEEIGRVRDMMERQLGQMVRLIDDLMDISRISSGKVVLRRVLVSLDAITEIAVESSRPVIESAHHALALDPSPEPVWVEADPARAAQVLHNLLTNAAKYTPAGGTITLSTRREGGSAVIRVRDTGLGIPGDLLSEVFGMFTQVNRTLDRAQGGLGIGLALVRKLVELHGGSVVAESAGSGCGSTFTVRLPLAESPPDERDPPVASTNVAPAAADSRLRVLIVDDNQDAADTLAMLLEYGGHVTRTAYDGAGAIDAAMVFVPDLVFLDLGLPGMDGYEVARRLRLEPSLAATILVALTGWGSESDRQRTREGGFDHHLTKPVEAAEVEAFVASLAAGTFRSVARDC